MRKKVGITGQIGFIGSHLTNFIKSKPEEFEIIPFYDEYFESPVNLKNFVSSCDCIVHLAAVNRDSDPNLIYNINILLVEKLISALKGLKKNPHIIFSSSIQEDKDNPYGRSKKTGRTILRQWADKNAACFTGLIIPNVFGPSSKPFYNSVVSTFSYQLNNNKTPKIDIDAELNLIYIHDLVKEIYDVIKKEISNEALKVNPTGNMYVSKILSKLNSFKEIYVNNNIIPPLLNRFEVCLFNTFRSFIGLDHFPVRLGTKHDNRGYLFEIVKENTGGQIFFSETIPGITRGNHYHTNKIERFCVLKGRAVIRLRKIGSDIIHEYKVSGDKPSIIDIPVYYTHNITNVGEGELLTLFWTNDIFDPDNSDTFHEKV